MPVARFSAAASATDVPPNFSTVNARKVDLDANTIPRAAPARRADVVHCCELSGTRPGAGLARGEAHPLSAGRLGPAAARDEVRRSGTALHGERETLGDGGVLSTGAASGTPTPFASRELCMSRTD